MNQVVMCARDFYSYEAFIAVAPIWPYLNDISNSVNPGILLIFTHIQQDPLIYMTSFIYYI